MHDPGATLLEWVAYLGDAIRLYQDAIAKEAQLSTAQRPTITVEVDGESWQQVDSLADSNERDRHFVVRRDEAGRAVIEFGDGAHGRRPAESAQIRARYRQGTRFVAVILQQGRVILDADWTDGPDVPRCCGIQRAIVIDSNDPLQSGRVRVQVPALGTDVTWALPCKAGTPLAVASGDTVWVMFEHGDPSRPVWIGRL